MNIDPEFQDAILRTLAYTRWFFGVAGIYYFMRFVELLLDWYKEK